MKIARDAKRLSSAPWGQNFERQIHKMALSAKELDQVRQSWNNLQKEIASRGLTAALKKSEISAWKTATLGHFAQVRGGLKQTQVATQNFSKAVRRAKTPAAQSPPRDMPFSPSSTFERARRHPPKRNGRPPPAFSSLSRWPTIGPGAEADRTLTGRLRDPPPGPSPQSTSEQRSVKLRRRL
ncbi:MAG: hypothetical protein E5X33_29740 [Mesorhizobium sp.]|uniref:hypothetical protein n=1 Tax=Mesorhizobium sp. TaxID=1871066 RepID=UPI0011FAC765|nr:hypothetical protein [Mesorhizobium sp.]TIR16171.1 MAG: hypothetical protein E5X33_29740 [Mesorhizobium sp.]